MEFNKAFFKRYSTAANMVALVAGVVITTIPSLGLSAQTAGYTMLVMNIMIGLSQAIKQGAGETDTK